MAAQPCAPCLDPWQGVEQGLEADGASFALLQKEIEAFKRKEASEAKEEWETVTKLSQQTASAQKEHWDKAKQVTLADCATLS